MTKKAQEGVSDTLWQATCEETNAIAERRQILKKLGRFAAATAPAVTLLLTATAKPKEAQAIS